MNLLPYEFNKIHFGSKGNGKVPNRLSRKGKTLNLFPDKERPRIAFLIRKAPDHFSRKVAPNFSSTFFNSFS
jgi:hypothetical protein